MGNFRQSMYILAYEICVIASKHSQWKVEDPLLIYLLEKAIACHKERWAHQSYLPTRKSSARNCDHLLKKFNQVLYSLDHIHLSQSRRIHFTTLCKDVLPLAIQWWTIEKLVAIWLIFIGMVCKTWHFFGPKKKKKKKKKKRERKRKKRLELGLQYGFFDSFLG